MSPDKSLNQMDFHHVADLTTLQPEPRFGGRWLEPAAQCPRVSPLDLEAICIPALAIDRKGFRLGNGGGFYDRYLGSIPDSCVRIALAFDFQMVEDVPTDCHDRQMHFALTESGMRAFTK
jgi:5,10-methenyltetrahydrofolate synthetase